MYTTFLNSTKLEMFRVWLKKSVAVEFNKIEILNIAKDFIPVSVYF